MDPITYEARFYREHALETTDMEWSTPDDALAFLRHGEEYGTLASDAVVDSTGAVVYDRETIRS